MRILRKFSQKNIVLNEAVRTPFCRSHTEYANLWPHQLLQMAFAGLDDRTKPTGFNMDQVEYACAGTVFDEIKTSNVAREAWLANGYANTTPAHTVSQGTV